MKKISNKKLLIGLSFGALLVFVVLCVLIDWFIEDWGNDSLPDILTSNVRMDRLWYGGLYLNNLKGNECSLEEKEKTTKFLKGKESFDIHEQYVTCQKYPTDKGTFYDIYPGLGCRATLLLEKTQDNIEYVIKDGSSKSPADGYPCNTFNVLSQNNDSIIIDFSGWRNPKKVVELTIK